jgi:hypothetical protein
MVRRKKAVPIVPVVPPLRFVPAVSGKDFNGAWGSK